MDSMPVLICLFWRLRDSQIVRNLSALIIVANGPRSILYYLEHYLIEEGHEEHIYILLSRSVSHLQQTEQVPQSGFSTANNRNRSIALNRIVIVLAGDMAPTEPLFNAPILRLCSNTM